MQPKIRLFWSFETHSSTFYLNSVSAPEEEEDVASVMCCHSGYLKQKL